MILQLLAEATRKVVRANPDCSVVVRLSPAGGAALLRAARTDPSPEGAELRELYHVAGCRIEHDEHAAEGHVSFNLSIKVDL